MRFEPFAYDHAACLIGERPWTVSRDAGLLVKAHRTAIETYALRSCVVGIDIYNVEAEAYGCALPEADGENAPTLAGTCCDEAAELLGLAFDPAIDGRCEMVVKAAEELKSIFPEVDIRVPVCGPFTIAGHLLGLENLICELMMNPETTRQALFHLADNQMRFAEMIVRAGLGITVFESSVTPPLLSPRLFADEVSPVLRLICDETAMACGERPQLIIGGDTRSILDTLLALEPSYLICPVETDQEMFLLGTMLHNELTVRVNMRPAVFCQAAPDAALAEAERVLELASRRRRTTIGTILPVDADPSIVKAVQERLQKQQ